MLPGLLTGPLGREALGEKKEQSLVCSANLAKTRAQETGVNEGFCFFLSFFLLIKDPDEEYLERGAKKSEFHHSQTQTNL